MERYRIEVPAVRQTVGKLQERLARFGERYCRVIDAGHSVCLTDNAMGRLAFQGSELIAHLRLPTPSGQVMAHVNTFHTLKELHAIIDTCAKLGVEELLVVSGDGSSRQPKLKPADLGLTGAAAVTSVELLSYLRRCYGNTFRYGAVFNQYEPADHEQDKLRRKLEAGAEFIITQPATGPQESLDRLHRELPVPLYIEAWMSPKTDLLSECVGYILPGLEQFDPLATLQKLHGCYPDSPMYLALVDFSTQFGQFPRFAGAQK